MLAALAGAINNFLSLQSAKRRAKTGLACRRWLSRRVPWWIPSRWVPSRRLPSLRLLFRPRLCRGGLRRLSARVPVLSLSIRGVPSLPGPRLRPRAGLPAAGLRGPLSPAGSLLHQRLLPSARRWGDGRLCLDMGAGRADGAPGSAEPLRAHSAPLLPRSVVVNRRRHVLRSLALEVNFL